MFFPQTILPDHFHLVRPILLLSKHVLGLDPKSSYGFLHKIKKTFLIFTNNCIDLDILSMPAIPCYWILLGRGQGCC